MSSQLKNSELDCDIKLQQIGAPVINIINISHADYKSNNNNNDVFEFNSENYHYYEKKVHSSSNARRRWRILARAINTRLNKVFLENNDETELSSFSLIEHEQLIVTNDIKESLVGRENEWIRYVIKMSSTEKQYFVNVHLVNKSPTAKELIGFNYTGNICVWPSEEALTYYILENLNVYENKWILELGGGMTCLSGLILAKYGNPYCVHLTDGNTTSVENIKQTLRLNNFSCFLKASVVKWESVTLDITPDFERYDFVLCADCLFFDESRIALVNAIKYYLSSSGLAIVVAPKRGNSLEHFIRLAVNRGFYYEIVYKYSQEIWNKVFHLKIKNFKYPILIKLTKSKLQ